MGKTKVTLDLTKEWDGREFNSSMNWDMQGLVHTLADWIQKLTLFDSNDNHSQETIQDIARRVISDIEDFCGTIKRG